MVHADELASVEYASTIRFANRPWQIKTSRKPIGPGPNRFSAANVRVDENGSLHLSINQRPDGWSCAEVVGLGDFGYGTYRWSLKSTVLNFAAPTVLGLFTWSDEQTQANRELDIEFSRWGNAESPVIGSFAVQRPTPLEPAVERFSPGPSRSTHELHWSPQRVQFRSRFGIAQQDWSYTGTDVSRPGGDVAPRMNLWLYRGISPTKPHSVTIEDFDYRPGK